MNKSGEEVIPLQYTGTYGGFVEGLASVRNNQNRLIFINKEGKQQIKDDFFEVDNFSEGIAPVRYEEGGNLFIIDKTGKKIISFSSEASQNNYYVRGGFIRVYEKNRVFIYDKKGNLVASFPNTIFDDIYHFKGYVFQARKPGQETPTSFCYINILDGTEYCDD